MDIIIIVTTPTEVVKSEIKKSYLFELIQDHVVNSFLRLHLTKPCLCSNHSNTGWVCHCQSSPHVYYCASALAAMCVTARTQPYRIGFKNDLYAVVFLLLKNPMNTPKQSFNLSLKTFQLPKLLKYSYHKFCLQLSPQKNKWKNMSGQQVSLLLTSKFLKTI